MATRPKTGGRVAGTPNKITLEIREVAKQHAGDAVAVLVAIMGSPLLPPAARCLAAKTILGYAYGVPGPVQPEAPGEVPLIDPNPEV